MENLGNECGLKANSNSKISSIVIARMGDSFSDVIILNFHSLRITINLNKLHLTFYFFSFSKSFEERFFQFCCKEQIFFCFESFQTGTSLVKSRNL